MAVGLVVAGVCAVGAVGLLWWRSSETKKLAAMRTLETVPISRLGSLAPGTAVELKGRLRTERPVKADFSGEAAIWVLARIDEIRKRRTTDGKTASDRSEISRNEQFADSVLEDASGRVPFDLRSATIEGLQTVNRTQSPPANDPSVAILALVVGPKPIQHHYTEHLIRPDSDVYVQASVLAGGGVGADPAGNNRFLVSIRSEEALSAGAETTIKWLTMSVVVLAAIATVSLIIGLG
jgi:E3 Ubiquitin ligase